MFRRIRAALVDGGTLVIDIMMEAGQPSEWPSFLTLFTRTVSGSAAHPFADYRDWLKNAGFSDVKQLSERWVAAVK